MGAKPAHVSKVAMQSLVGLGVIEMEVGCTT